MRKILLMAVVLQAMPVVARAGPAAAPRSAAPLDELVVTGRVRCLPAVKDGDVSAPRLVSTFPANDAVIRPGVTVVRATFDRPMTCAGFFWETPPFASPCPQDVQKMVMSLDRRTFRTLCATRPNTVYRLRMTPAKPDAFSALNGVEAEAYEITFRTSTGPKVNSIPDALAQDAAAKLKP